MLEIYVSVFFVIMVANIIAVFIQLLWPNKGFELVARYYTSQTRSTLDTVHQSMTFLRSYGLNYSPVLLGFKSLLCFTSLLFCLDQKLNPKLIRKLKIVFVISMVNGLFSFSKTFIIGASISLLVFIFKLALGGLKNNFMRNRTVISIVLVISCFLIIVLNANTLELATGLPFRYYFGKILTNPKESLKTRYSYEFVPADTQLTYDVIREHPILGVGYTSHSGEFIGDSEYLNMMHGGGAVSVIMELAFIAILVYITLKRHDMLIFGVILATFLSGMSVPTLYSDLIQVAIGVYMGFLGHYELGNISGHY